CQLMLVGGYFFAVHAEVGIAIADWLAFGVLEIAKDLVVGSIFFDDVEDVFDGAGLAYLIGNDRFAASRSPVKRFGAIRGIAAHLFGVGRHLRGVRPVDERN